MSGVLCVDIRTELLSHEEVEGWEEISLISRKRGPNFLSAQEKESSVEY
jgi:hypothetical protein